MEERKTAAVVLGIVALVAIFFTLVLPYVKFHSTQTLAFKNCTVTFKYWDKGLVTDIYRASQNKLALCLCDSYKEHADTAVANHVITIYRLYGGHNNGTQLYNNIDSIIKYKSSLLDTTILVD